jgi:hypothetical protein
MDKIEELRLELRVARADIERLREVAEMVLADANIYMSTRLVTAAADALKKN